MSEKTTINYDAASCQPVIVAGVTKGYAIYCPVSVPTGPHKLQQFPPISKSSGKTRSIATTKGSQAMALTPLDDGRLAQFNGSVRLISTQAEIQEGKDAGIVNV